MVKESAGVALMVKALAPALNTIALSSTSLDKVMEGLFEVAQVATSLGPLGTALGTQLVAVFQSPEVGLRFQVALPAKAPRESRMDNQESYELSVHHRAPTERPGRNVRVLIVNRARF